MAWSHKYLTATYCLFDRKAVSHIRLESCGLFIVSISHMEIIINYVPFVGVQ